MTLTIFNNGNSLNNGVMAMAVALVSEMRDINPDIVIKVALDNPVTKSKDSQRYSKCDIGTVDNSLGYALYKYRYLFPIYGKYWLYRQAKHNRKKVPNRMNIASSDAMISLCGEDFFSDNWPKTVCRFTQLQCEAALLTNTPLIVLAQTFGPFKREWSRAYAKRYLKYASLVTARDLPSFENLQSIDVVKNSHHTADLAYLMKSWNILKIRGDHVELSELDLSNAIGISVSGLFSRSVFKQISDRAIRSSSFFSVFAEVLEEIIREHGKKIIFVPHVTLEHNDDRKAAVEVVNRMHDEVRKQVVILNDEYLAPEIKGVIGQMHAFIGCRMHALIAAVSQNVPTMALAYSPKTLGVIGQGFEYPYLLDARSITPEEFITQFKKKISLLLSNTTEIRNTLETTMFSNVLPKARENIRLLLETVDHS